MSSRARPELQAPPEIFYNDDEARKYTSSSRIIDIQAKLSERALELLALPDDDMPRLLLDIGCGSGLSGETLTENGHQWIGLDISPSMLNIALEREVDGDLILGDMGQGLGLRPGVIDGAISISAVQWLCNADKSSHEPRLRLKAFFGSLYRSLARGARAVLQVYPENLAQRELILGFAMRAGFSGGIVVDFPHSTKQRKEYLVLTCGPPSLSSAAAKGKGPSSPEQLSSPLSSAAAKGKGEDGEESRSDDGGSGYEENKSVHVSDKVHAKGKGEDGEESCSDDDGSGHEENKSVHVSERHRPRKKQKLNKKVKGREWVLHKKEQLRRKGNTVPLDTKYTARKRKARF